MFSWCSGLNGELAVCTFLKSIKPWMWVLDFVRELWLERTHCWRSCWGQHAPELMYWRLSMAWRRTLYCLQFNEVVYLACPLLKYQMAEVLFWLKDIFFSKLETPKLLTVVCFQKVKECLSPWLETGLKYGTFHPSRCFSPVVLVPKWIMMEIPQLGQSGRVLDIYPIGVRHVLSGNAEF